MWLPFTWCVYFIEGNTRDVLKEKSEIEMLDIDYVDDDEAEELYMSRGRNIFCFM